MPVRERVSHIENVEIVTGFLRLQRWGLAKEAIRSRLDIPGD